MSQELSDEEIAALRHQFGITSDGRGIKEWAQVQGFARAIIAADRAKRVPMQLVGYYHKAPSGDPDEDDMFFADAINGDCPNCHPLYMDACVTLTAKAEHIPMTVEQQTEAAKAMAAKANHDLHIISFMMGVEAAESFHGIGSKTCSTKTK
jgi:hypothetical protein